jgi:hypothetical protein
MEIGHFLLSRHSHPSPPDSVAYGAQPDAHALQQKIGARAHCLFYGAQRETPDQEALKPDG